MPDKFEPYKKQGKGDDFSVWEYKAAKNNEERVLIDEQDAVLAECELLRQQAVEKGYAEGLQQAQAEINEKKKEFAHWFDLIKNPVKLIDDQIIQELIQTILWLSQHCIAVELSVNPDKLRDLLYKIKIELPSLNTHRILAMSPLDIAWVQAEIGENEIPGLHEILVADPGLKSGDFYLKSDHSELDGRIHTRFATLFAKHITKESLIVPMQIQD